MTALALRDVSVRLHGRTVLQAVSLTIEQGECVGLIGPNGAGKTTLMRAAQALIPFAGHSSLADMPSAARARHVAWMPQAREIAWPITVESVVMLGRIPHLGSGRQPTETDRSAVEHALEQLDLTAMRSRPATQLSGGEQARVLIARALAQDTLLLMADEPCAGLDPAHQIATMERFTTLADQGRSVLVSLHDLGLAARHCSRLILLGNGGLVADGPPETVLTPDRLAQVFGITAWCERTADGLIYQPLEVLR